MRLSRGLSHDSILSSTGTNTLRSDTPAHPKKQRQKKEKGVSHARARERERDGKRRCGRCRLQRLLRWLRHPTYGTEADAGFDDEAHVRSVAFAARCRSPALFLSFQSRAFVISCRVQAADAGQARWSREIAAPFARGAKRETVERDTAPRDAGCDAARDALVCLLKATFVRHSKEDIDLPKPIYSNKEIEVEGA